MYSVTFPPLLIIKCCYSQFFLFVSCYLHSWKAFKIDMMCVCVDGVQWYMQYISLRNNWQNMLIYQYVMMFLPLITKTLTDIWSMTMVVHYKQYRSFPAPLHFLNLQLIIVSPNFDFYRIILRAWNSMDTHTAYWLAIKFTKDLFLFWI
jgi:hypothetical protein